MVRNFVYVLCGAVLSRLGKGSLSVKVVGVGFDLVLVFGFDLVLVLWGNFVKNIYACVVDKNIFDVIIY